MPIPWESRDDWLAVDMDWTTSLANSIGYLKSNGSSCEFNVRSPCLQLICHPRTCNHRREMEISNSCVSIFSSTDTAEALNLCWISINHVFEQLVFLPRPFQTATKVSSIERNKFARSTNPYSSRGSSDWKIDGSFTAVFRSLTWFCRCKA